MLIRNYGLFWWRDEVEWNPGKGRPLRILGRQGRNLPNRKVADFRDQHGLYILYGNYGPVYVGLTTNALGRRLQDHTTDRHRRDWDRFSWFGFKRVLMEVDSRGLQILKGKLASSTQVSAKYVIRDSEALLIRALGLPSNTNHTKFTNDEAWVQLQWHDDRDREILERLGME